MKSPNEQGPLSPNSSAFSPHSKSPKEQGPLSPYSPALSPHSQGSNHQHSRSLPFPQPSISTTNVNGKANYPHTIIQEQLHPPKLNKLLSQHQLPTLLMDVFPTSYKYMFKSFEPKASNNVPSFCAVVQISSVRTEEQATQWIKDLESHTSTTYRITRGNQCKGKRIIYKTDRHCQHMRKKLSKKLKQCGTKRMTLSRDKKTDYPTHFTLKLHANQAVQLPCELIINWEHNHSIQSAHALSFRSLSEGTVSKFEEYFKQGHSPSSAIHLHGLNLAIEYEGKENKLQRISADRSKTPLPMDVYYLYRKWRVNNLGEECGEKMFDRLDEAVVAYNKEYNEAGGYALLQRYDKGHSESVWEKKANICTEQPLVLAICTPLMSRAHNLLRQLGELVYCDSTASLDRFNCPTFIISTSSSAGGIPLGIVITSGESEAVLTEAFSLLKKILPEKAFYGRGYQGPQLCMTDDCDAEKGALKNNWSQITLLLCVFHFLQSWWKWLWDNTHGIHKDDRQPIILIVKKLVYAPTKSELESCYDNLMKQNSPESYITKYPQLAKCLQQFWERRGEWAISHRLDLITRGNHTNNYAEAGMRVLKEIIFGRVKAFNLIQMFQFVTTTMEAYFTNRLLDIAHSRYRPGVALKYKEVDTKGMEIKEIKKCRQSIYVVKLEVKQIGELEYVVDMELGMCSCSKGSIGAACKHQAAVAKQFNISSLNIAPVHSKEARMQYATLATGKALDEDFYAHLRDTITSTKVENIHHHRQTQPQGDVAKPDQPQDEVACGFGDNDSTLTLGDGTATPDTDDLWQEQLEHFKLSLNGVVQDMMSRLEGGDHNVISGVSAFVCTYQKMVKSSPAPSAAIAYALHHFGKADSKVYNRI